MEMKILKSSKDEMEIEFESLTLAEIIRVYLNKDSAVSFSAWTRAHSSHNPRLLVQTKGKTAKKAVNEAISTITKDLDKAMAEFKKLK